MGTMNSLEPTIPGKLGSFGPSGRDVVGSLMARRLGTSLRKHQAPWIPLSHCSLNDLKPRNQPVDSPWQRASLPSMGLGNTVPGHLGRLGFGGIGTKVH